MNHPNRQTEHPAVRHITGESPLDWLIRRGWDLHCFDGHRVARKRLADGTTKEYSAETTRRLAQKMGWYP